MFPEVLSNTENLTFKYQVLKVEDSLKSTRILFLRGYDLPSC